MSTSTERPMAKLAIGGAVTVSFEAFGGGHLLEFLKIKKQTNQGRTYGNIMREIIKIKGLSGVMDGFMPWGFTQSLIKGSVFSWGQALSMRALHGNPNLSQQQTLVLTGGMGGFVQGVFMSPVLYSRLG